MQELLSVYRHCRAIILLLAAIACFTTGCESSFRRIDRHVEQLLAQTSQNIGPDAFSPLVVPDAQKPVVLPESTDPAAEQPQTFNPPADALPFSAIDEAEDVLDRLNRYGEISPQALKLTLADALSLATRSSREYKFAQEQYVLAALRLLQERHLWGPRFFNDVRAEVVAFGDDGLYDAALQVVNEFAVTQRLPYGGEVSARLLAAATEDLHQRVAGENVQSAELILAADIPLLRGAGLSARETRIQAERNLVYAARDFEIFRREFLFDIAREFLDLVVQQQAVMNAERQVARLLEVQERELALYEAGRTPRFEAALAEQDTFRALDNLNTRREFYRLAVDRFKVRLGLPIDQDVIIVPSTLDLPIPAVDLEEAVRLAMRLRLDLQTQRDIVDDARRLVEIARNDLLPDLDVFGSVSIPTDRRRARAGLRFDPHDSDLRAGVLFSLPLDREIERLTLREAQIRLERAMRAYDEQRDLIAVEVRATARDIDRALYALQIQEQSVQIGEERRASIDAAPDRATARDRSEAADELLRAQDARDAARRDLEVAILRYLLETGQLRVNPEGSIRLLRGMMIDTRHDPDPAPDASAPSDHPDPADPPAEPFEPADAPLSTVG